MGHRDRLHCTGQADSPTAEEPLRAIEPDTGQLVMSARSGSLAAWEQLYVRCYPRLFAYARRRMSSEDHARDAVSETMVRAVSGLGGFANQGGGFRAWLYGILRHVVLDQQQRLWREIPMDPEAPTSFSPSSDGSCFEVMVDVEDVARLRTAFARLKPAEREILELRVVAGLSADAVAAMVGRSPGAVRMAQARALSRLRRHLSDEGQDGATRRPARRPPE